MGHTTAALAGTTCGEHDLLAGGSLCCPICQHPEQEIVLAAGNKSLRRCSRCGVRFTHPQPSFAELEAHFEKGGNPGFGHLEASFERNRQRVLSRVASYIQARKQDGAILDFGCATGFFLSHFFADSRWTRSGVELSDRAAQIAATKGIDVFAGTLTQAALKDDLFDVITMLDAIFYLPHPQDELIEIRRILRPGGILIVELPLASGRIWRTSGRIGRLLSRTRQGLLESSDHVFYYDRKSINFLLERCGFVVKDVLALPANRQPELWRDLMYRLFSFGSSALSYVSGSKIFLGPRFLIAATKGDRPE